MRHTISTLATVEQGVGVRVLLAGPLAVPAGYRSIQTDFEDDNDLVDFDVDGVFFSASLRF